jgi:hypothetical protein
VRNCTGAVSRLAARIHLQLMKNDYSFKLVAAIVFAGVIVALVSPSHALPQVESTTSEATPIVNHTE